MLLRVEELRRLTQQKAGRGIMNFQDACVRSQQMLLPKRKHIVLP